jgi:hypothetical protein
MRPTRPKHQTSGGWPLGALQQRTPGSAGRKPQDEQADYKSFRASLLFCPKCRQATPTRERLLLVLPTGNLYEYLCAQCGTSTGSKTDKEQEVRLFIP